jgi:shikimate dehydrogenase
MSSCLGLIGYPLKHSISPYFQQAALDFYRLDIRYEAWETIPVELPAVVKNLRNPENLGANVTVPYKETVLSLLDAVDDLACSIGAVNTIVKKGNKLVGANTDAHGFIEALDRERHFDPRGKRVVMLGAGGVARAVSFVLLQRKIASLAITDGVFERAHALADDLVGHIAETSSGSRDSEPSISSFEWQNLDSSITLAACDLIVHCTTIGMKGSPQEGQSPLSLEMIPKGVLVYDVVYNPRLTPLLKLAREAGADTLDGLPMLVYQGAASFRLWLGKEAPVDVMLKTAQEMLAGKQQR